ncbi:MAG: hypothetical protein GWQ05_13330 [Verrucomicrobiaceae bacterium]|nr:hypothetical protein [Verrucomicrobiaceae bacterium]
MRVIQQRAWLARMFVVWGVLLFDLHALYGTEMPRVIFVRVDEATADFFDDTPSPLDYAAFLKNIQKHGPRCVGMVDLLRWPQVAPEILNGLIREAKSLNVVYAAMLDNDAPDTDLAKSLRAFPQDFLATGDLGLLASFKSVSRLPDEGLLENSAAGFTIIDFGVDVNVTASGIEVPLVARGPNSELALSLPMLIAGQALGLSWNTVSINIGTALQLGDGTEPIPLDQAGKVVVPLEEPVSLQRLGGDRLIASDLMVEAVRDAVLIVGSDLERDRLFPLPNGQRVSRPELVSLTVCYLLEQATAASVSLPAEPAPVAETNSALPAKDFGAATVDKPISPSTNREVYHFPDLRASSSGLWILGIGCGLAFVFLLLLSKRKQDRPEVEETAPEGVHESAGVKPDLAETPAIAASLTKEREESCEKKSTKTPEKQSDAVGGFETEGLANASPSKDNAAPTSEASEDRDALLKKAKKRPARNKKSQSRRRRPS